MDSSRFCSDADHAVVIGAGLGGLAAAMRLGARGYRVTVLDRLKTPGGRASAIWSGGHRFDLGPTIVTVPQVFEELWAACGRSFSRDIDLRPMDPFYEIRWPDGSSFQARGSTSAMEAEVARLSPRDVSGYLAFLRDAEARYEFGFEDLGRRPMHQLWELIKVLPKFAWYRADRSIYAHAARRVRDPRLRMALSFHPLFIGGDPTKVTSMYALVAHLEKQFGVHYAMGGVEAIAKAMVRIIEAQGGCLRQECQVDEILLEPAARSSGSTRSAGAARGVRLEDGTEIAADIVVSNADPGHTYDHLLRRHSKRRWSTRKLTKARWSMGLFVWYFGTRGTRDMWQDVGHHTILSGPRYRRLLRDIFRKGHLADDMSLYLHRPSVTDGSVAPEGDDTFYALSPVPHLGWDNGVDWKQQAERYRQRVLEVLEAGPLPGLTDRLSQSLVFTPENFRSRYLSPLGCGFSLEPRILQSAWFRPHNVSEEAKGLFLVGAGTHPGAGLPGVISAAEVLDQLVPDPAIAHIEAVRAAE
ncbi:phytoene desaturase [Phaeobacter sp.]|uniref:phytoene desaturase n=1 Tax=Phaeobacter sp. TaxID=1902409 RepID=UPI0025DCAACD|nr:phytoene desaturase [Phaeobacter sp.]